MAENSHMPENEWIRYRIGRLQALRRDVTDTRTIRAIDDLIAEAEERLQMLKSASRDRSA